MPAITDCRSYPYPSDIDRVDVAGDIERLAQAVDDDVCQLATSLVAVPVGAMLMFGGVAAPAGFLLCRGQAVLRNAFPALFSAISTAYGAGDGTTTFNVPNMQGTLAVGFNAKTNPPPGIGTEFSSALGERAGSPNATLPSHQHAGVDHLHGVNQFVGNELQAHNHTIGAGELYRYNPFVPSGYHAGGVPGNGAPYDIIDTNGMTTGVENQAHNHAMNAATDAADRNLATGFTGVSPQTANYPPCQSFNYIIRAT